MKSAAAGTEAYEDIALDETRLAEALALSSEAGWNQEADDWRLLFRHATAFGRVRRRDGALVGSSTVLPLGQGLSWIGMVLVTGAERRRGHGRHLMRLAMDHIAASGAVAGLDATPAGRDLYRSLGFEDTATLMRMRCESLPSPLRGEPALGLRPEGAGGGGNAGPGADIRLVTVDDLAAICIYDTQAFGAERTPVLHDLHSRCPQTAFLAESDGRLTGFVLARPGRVATQIGPLVADDAGTAEQLLNAALGSVSGPLIVDVFTTHAALCRRLTGLNFAEQRPFTRMLNGAVHLPHDRTILSAGPELG